MKELKQISHDAFYKMEDYHQISIDLIEEAELLIENSDEESEQEIRQLIEELGALSYNVGTTLEVFNPIYENEISDLRDVSTHIDNKMELLKIKYSEFK